MVTIQCGKSARLDISEIYPGAGETWVAGDPAIVWGDGGQTTNVTGTSISHTYANIGSYTIYLEGENSCGEVCNHSETVVLLENPATRSTINITQNSAKVQWYTLLGKDRYDLELYNGTQFISSWNTVNIYSDITELEPDTAYTVYVSATISGYKSEDYCGDNIISFTTLPEACEIPSCGFTVI